MARFRLGAESLGVGTLSCHRHTFYSACDYCSGVVGQGCKKMYNPLAWDSFQPSARILCEIRENSIDQLNIVVRPILKLYTSFSIEFLFAIKISVLLQIT